MIAHCSRCDTATHEARCPSCGDETYTRMAGLQWDDVDQMAINVVCIHVERGGRDVAVRVTYEGPTVPRVFRVCMHCAVHVHAYLMDLAARPT